jgi:catechol 2,3-dioxygenase-like lactoylglutathione lyase family enzyme
VTALNGVRPVNNSPLLREQGGRQRHVSTTLGAAKPDRRTPTRSPVAEEFELPTIAAADPNLPGTLELGAFSISLTVADLERSKDFYAKLGFIAVGGDSEHDYLIMKNGETTIGLFHGMFETNTLTFNPGLTNRMERLETFNDVRNIQDSLTEAGIALSTEVEPNTEGAASITLTDPDGNVILIDQFF